MITTKILKTLQQMPAEVQHKFVPVFGGVNNFYQVVYLLVRNLHEIEQNKLDQWEYRKEVITKIRQKIEYIVSLYELDGESIVADIASDYFEDFTNYKVQEVELSQEDFLGIIKLLSTNR